jgi:oligopeptide transport system permease protein
MGTFILRRLLWTIPVLLLVFTLVFFAMRSIGGNPFRHGPLVGFGNPHWVKYGDFQPESIEHNQRHRYGLDLPWYRQYANYLEGAATLDFGPSLTYRNRTVNEIVRTQGGISLELGVLAFVWALVVGIPLGVLAATRRGSALDRVLQASTSLAYALPSFLVGTLLVYVFAVELGWLPTSGWGGWRHLVLPALTLGVVPMALFARLTRGAMVETLQHEYVLAARARGVTRRRILFVHALKNSLVPVVTAAGPLLGTLLTGVFIVEAIFSIPGIGRYYVTSVLARDYPVVMALTLLLAFVVVLANLVVDVLYGVLDPRTRERR